MLLVYAGRLTRIRPAGRISGCEISSSFACISMRPSGRQRTALFPQPRRGTRQVSATPAAADIEGEAACSSADGSSTPLCSRGLVKQKCIATRLLVALALPLMEKLVDGVCPIPGAGPRPWESGTRVGGRGQGEEQDQGHQLYLSTRPPVWV